jgi:hypothetical protein
VARLTALIESEGAEVFAANQVIGGAYIALQHHYGVTKAEAREGLATPLQSGLVAPARVSTSWTYSRSSTAAASWTA